MYVYIYIHIQEYFIINDILILLNIEHYIYLSTKGVHTLTSTTLQTATLDPRPATLTLQPSTLDPQPATLTPQPSPLLSTLTPQTTLREEGVSQVRSAPIVVLAPPSLLSAAQVPSKGHPAP